MQFEAKRKTAELSCSAAESKKFRSLGESLGCQRQLQLTRIRFDLGRSTLGAGNVVCSLVAITLLLRLLFLVNEVWNGSQNFWQRACLLSDAGRRVRYCAAPRRGQRRSASSSRALGRGRDGPRR